MTASWVFTPIIIVSFRTPSDLAACLASLDALQSGPRASIHICENGGPDAFEKINAALLSKAGPCVPCPEEVFPSPLDFRRIACMRLRNSGRLVLVGEAPQNLGYAGGINMWLRPLARLTGWQGCWILNPDASVDPASLASLSAEAKERGLGMIGSKLLTSAGDMRISNGGLRWRRVLAMPGVLCRNVSAAMALDHAAIESGLDAPSGASCYITRPCADALTPLDERYFLLFEDLDWGIRAKRLGFRLGLSDNSITYHAGGQSLDASRSKWSPLRSYLGFRNSIVFVRSHFPLWLLWTMIAGILNAIRLSPRISVYHALRGLAAGISGETGRPDWLLNRPKVHSEVVMASAMLKKVDIDKV